jgi:hypothetical protein
MQESSGQPRTFVPSLMAVLIALLALSNATKALQFYLRPGELGIVIFGFHFQDVLSNALLGPPMGVLLGAYAYGLWTRKAWVIPASVAHAFYVPLNLVLFWYMKTNPEIPPLGGMLAYLAVALPGSIGTALYVAYHRDEFKAPV